jgi:hypothetical protein
LQIERERENKKKEKKRDSLSHVCKKKKRKKEIDKHSKCANKRATEKKQE